MSPLRSNPPHGEGRPLNMRDESHTQLILMTERKYVSGLTEEVFSSSVHQPFVYLNLKHQSIKLL